MLCSADAQAMLSPPGAALRTRGAEDECRAASAKCDASRISCKTAQSRYPTGDPCPVRLQVGVLRAAIVLVLALISVPWALAQSDCELGFATWAKFSKASLRPAPPSDDRGACLASETVRKELLAGLARARANCEASPSWLDQSPQRTKMMIDINETFIGSLAVCPNEQPESSAVDVKPTAPKPPGPTPVAAKWATSVQTAPKPVAPPPTASTPVASIPPAPTPPARKAVVPPGGCLDPERPKPEHIALVNRRCSGETVLAVVERRDVDGKIACKAYSVAQSVTFNSDNRETVKLN